MTSFTTANGTELPVISLKGKDYLQVAHRLVWMREEHPDWGIVTKIIAHNEERSVVHAEILSDKGQVVGSGHKQEEKGHFPDHLEKAETGAIGRALAMCGYGTQFTADEFDEGKRLADAPLERSQRATGAPGEPKASAQPPRNNNAAYSRSGKEAAIPGGVQNVTVTDVYNGLSKPKAEGEEGVSYQKVTTDKGAAFNNSGRDMEVGKTYTCVVEETVKGSKIKTCTTGRAVEGKDYPFEDVDASYAA